MSVALPAASAAISTLQSWIQWARDEENTGVALEVQRLTVQPLNRDEFQSQVAAAATIEEAIHRIFQTPLRLQRDDVTLAVAQLQLLVQSCDRNTLTALAGELAMRHQAVMQREATTILRESACALGFTQVVERPSEGYLMARLPGSHMVIRADVTLDDDGVVNVATDTEGFYGTACEETTARLFAEAAKRGLHVQNGEKRTKILISQQNRRRALAPAAVRNRNA
jgi:hypothetical protein